MNRYFIVRLMSLLLVIGALCFYQNKANAWEQAEQENQKEIQEVNAYNRTILAKQSTVNLVYKDGIYEGQGEGFGGIVKVSVEIKQDNLEKIRIVEALGEDAAYLSMAESMIEEMITKQTPQVDTVSGATYSSVGIKTAVEDALSKAKVQ